MTINEACTLESPFRNKEGFDDATKHNIFNNDAPNIGGEYSVELNCLIQSMLSKDPKLRPTARQICEMPLIHKSF